MPIDQQTVVIGAGMTGLACAYRLKQLGVSVLLLEASRRAGGIIAAVRHNGFLFESGPQCPRFPRTVRKLVRDIGLEPEFLPAHPRAQRYILRRGQLYPAPLSPWALLLTSLIGFREKARFFAEPFAQANPPDGEESLAAFVGRKFGSATLDYLVDPFVSAVFFADPADMGMESALPSVARWEREQGSVFRGALKSRKNGKRSSPEDSMMPSAKHSSTMRLAEVLPPLGSFKNGLAALTEALAEKLGSGLRLGARVEVLHPTVDSPSNWFVKLDSGEEMRAQSVVLAVPADQAASLLRDAAPHLSSLLAQIPYSPLAVVCSAYDRSEVRHSLDGFGFVVPRREGLHTISSTWNSSIFARRAPAGKVLIANFARPLRDEPFLEMPSEEIAAVVEREVAPILGISGPAVERRVWIYRNALPHFRIGHAARLVEIREAERALPGLHLAGNYFAGRSIGDCVENAFHAAENVWSELKAPAPVVGTTPADLPPHDMKTGETLLP